MTRRVFQAGFNWKVIDAKWPGFEAAFDGFDPQACANMSEERFDALLKDTRIVRNAAKIRSVIFNARLVVELAAAYGSAARCFAEWPDSDYVGLLELLKQRADRLSGHAGMYFLRAIGRPAFITSRDVTAALIREGVVAKEPTSKRDLAAVQAAFNIWSAQSGRDLTTISRILAMSVGPGEPAAT
jgi:3-methyladenine DNA glycosylase Tag